MSVWGKYLTITSISFSEDFAYRLNVLLWRVRMFLQILISLFLWQAVFDSRAQIFHYSRGEMLTYILLTQLVRPFVFASRSVDVAEVIASGELTNIILKPIGFLRYYFVRDIGNKVLNLSFAGLEFFLLLFLFKIDFHLELALPNLILFLLSLLIATLIFFFLNMSLGFLAFWIPENAWAPRFFFFIFFDFFSGSLFPLDIFSGLFSLVLKSTPFYYLLFFPSGLLLGRFDASSIISGLAFSLVWLLLLYKLSRKLWDSGLRSYGAWGR